MATITDPDVGLGIYTAPVQEARISNGSNWLNPLLLVVDGTVPSALEKRLYIGSNDELHAYTGADPSSSSAIKVSIVDGAGIADGSTTGWEWKMRAGDEQPTEAEWAAITAGSPIYLPRLADPLNNTDGAVHIFLPFWVRIEVPQHAPRRMITSTYFRIEAVRQDVGWYATALGL